MPSRPSGLGSLPKNLRKFAVSLVAKSLRATGKVGISPFPSNLETEEDKETEGHPGKVQSRSETCIPELSSLRGWGRPASPRTRFSHTLRPTIPETNTR